MEGEAERRQIVDVVEERADGTLSLEGVEITQPWLSAQSLAMAAANRPGPEFGREHSPEVALSPPPPPPPRETELSPRPLIKRTYPSRIERTYPSRIERTYPPRIERTCTLRTEQTAKTNSEQISGARLDDFMSAEVRVTSGAESRTEADCGTRTPPGHPPASRKEAVNASLDTTVPVMEVPLASSSSGLIDFPRRGIVGAGRTTAPARVTA